MPPSTSLRLAVAGCHRMLIAEPTSHNFAAPWAAHPQVEISAVFDKGAQERAQFAQRWGPLPTYANFEEMLAACQPDLLCLATRQTQHADQIEAAVAAGVRGILCDKPLATSLDELDRILAACRDTPLLLALDRRWQPPYQRLAQLLHQGAIGPVLHIAVHGLPNLINHGCHWYDTALLLAGDPEPLWVCGGGEAGDPERGALDPPGWTQVGLDNGAHLSIDSAGAKMAFDITGENGRLVIHDDAQTAWLWGPGDTTPQALQLPAADAPWPAGTAMIEDLVNAVQTDRRNRFDLAQIRRATELGFAVHLSHAQQGGRIDLPAARGSLRLESFPWGNE